MRYRTQNLMILLFTLIALAVITACQSPFAIPTPTPPPGFLRVESWFPDPSQSLYLYEPSFNADGRYLAVFGGPQPEVVKPAIYIVDTNDKTIAFESPESFPWDSLALSLDGQLIAVCEDSSTINNQQLRIHLIDWRTNKSSYLADGCQPAWSPDSKQLAFVYYTADFGSSQGRVQIHLLELATGEEKMIFDIPAPNGVIHEMVWSPDGRRLAFTMDPDVVVTEAKPYRPKQNLYILGINGSDFKQLTDGQQVASPTFLSDGRRILYIALREIAQEPNKLTVVDLDGNCRQIEQPMDFIGGVSLSLDGEKIALWTTNGGLLMSEASSVIQPDFWTSGMACD
jgi:tricorn protease-like protein